ncbi:hypothetical protein Tco_0218072 [Tanacetum coccineum]
MVLYVSLKRGREDKDKDEDHSAGSDQGMKDGRQARMLNSQKYAEAEELTHIVGDTEVKHNQGQDMGNTDDQPNVEAALRHDWFKKPTNPPTPDSDWNARKSIDNLTQDHLVGPAFNLLKGTCRSRVELEYNIEESYKSVTDRLEWNNPKGNEYPFNLSKPLPHGSIVMESDKGRGRPSTGSQKLPEESQYHQARETFRSDISNRIPYTAYNNPQGIIYEDKLKRNRLMRTDKLYQFSDWTLTYVTFVLHDIASNLRMDYLSKQRWSSLDKKRSRIMIKAIDQVLLERRLMRSLEKFIGGRDYEEGLQLLQQTI